MEQIIVNVIVAAAFLFLARWLFKNFASKRAENAPACGACPQCSTHADAVHPEAAPVVVKK